MPGRACLLLFAAACGRIGYDELGEPDLAPDAGTTADIAHAFAGLTKSSLDCEPVGSLTVDLQARTTTATEVLWTWTRPGLIGPLAEYRLGISTEPTELARGEAYWLTSEHVPELGTPLLERYTTSWATSRNHAPSTAYVARLVAILPNGDCLDTDMATALTTPAYTEDLIVYADAAPPGVDRFPVAYVPSSTSPYRGSAHLEYQSVSDAWENLLLDQLDISLARVPADAFERAVVELALRVDAGDVAALWTALHVGIGGTVYHFDNATFTEDGSYHLHRVRLAAVVDDNDRPLQHADLSGRLTQIGIGSDWNLATRVCVDEIRLRW